MSRRVSGCRNTPVAQTQRTRQYNATRTHGNAQVHCRDSHANAGAPCGHTRTRMHAVAPAARALSSCARRRMAWQLQLSISTMLAMAHILLTTRDTSVTTTVRKRAAHALCIRLCMRTPAESFAPAKYRRMHAACCDKCKCTHAHPSLRMSRVEHAFSVRVRIRTPAEPCAHAPAFQ